MQWQFASYAEWGSVLIMRSGRRWMYGKGDILSLQRKPAKNSPAFSALNAQQHIGSDDDVNSQTMHG